MKLHITILTLVLAFAITSCTSVNNDSHVVESDTGRIYPASHIDHLRGMASGQRDVESIRSSDSIIAKAGIREADPDSVGTHYPGPVKVLSWDNGRKYHAMRLVQCEDGTQFWQGPTPASGFYSSDLKTSYLY